MMELKYNKAYAFKPFVFIGERLSQKYDPKKPFIKDYFLKPANAQQIDAIKRIVKTDEFFAMSNERINVYENDLNITVDVNGHSVTRQPLSPSKFKYWVIELSQYLFDRNLLPSISLLSKELTVIAEVGQLGAYRFEHVKAAVFYSNWSLICKEPIEINDLEVSELASNYSTVENFEKSTFKSSSIGKSVNDYLRINVIEHESPFKIIALFSIIESLLTTNNKNSDQTINRQLQKKIKLLNNQFPEKIDFLQFFKGPDTLTEELIIEKLYTYRSKIAHGDYYDFNKELQILTSHNKTYEFLNLLTKRLLLFAMNNCQLVLDLKEC